MLGYNTDIYFYVSTGIDPCYKYYGNQDWISRADNKIGKELEKFLTSGKAKYLVASDKIKFKKIVYSNYKLIDRVNNLGLYQYRE